jgi:glutaredoxin
MDLFTDIVYNVTMYTKDNCEFCEKAKNLLYSKEQYVITEVNLTDNPSERSTVKENLGNTVPQIIIEGKHIGGYEELQEYFNQWN